MKKILTALVFFAPSLVLADPSYTAPLTNAETGLAAIFASVLRILNNVVPVLLAIAGIIFIWGVITYAIRSAPDEKATARGYIIWGIVGIAIILSFWGLASLLGNVFGLSGASLGTNEIPRVNTGTLTQPGS
jgi:hypothetical protein